jgi:hypothetical protein
MFRARHGYKEAHTPNQPIRRNRDFRAMQYGSARGILNFRHSEPYCLLKNVQDIAREDHNIVIRWTKQALIGALWGAAGGMLYFTGGNTGNFEMNKLMAATGTRNYSGRLFR